MYRNKVAAAFSVSAALVFAPAASSQSVTPDVLGTQSLWTSVCSGDGACQLRAQLQTDGVWVSQVLIYDVGAETVLEYLVPLGLDLVTGISLVVDGARAANSIVLTCKDIGCIGYTPLSADLLEALKRGRTLALTFEGFDDGTPYAINYNLIGFTSAFEEWSQSTQ